MRTTAAVIEDGEEKFVIRDLEIDPPGYSEVQVRFVASGLCHTDLHVLDRTLVPRYPIVMGHEGSGIVEAVGPGVTRVKEGDHIVCSFVPTCGRCRYCAAGRSSLCDMAAAAVSGEFPDGGYRFHGNGTDYGSFCTLGTFSERATVSEFSVVKIDEWIPLEIAALVGCGVPTGWGSATVAGDVRPGDITVVYGVGGIGINAVQGAVHAGAKYVIAVDPVQFKRDKAIEFGATHVFADAAEAAAKVDELSWGQGADQAIVTVGVAEEDVITAAFSVIGKGGTAVLTSVGPLDAKTIHVPGIELSLNEKTIKGTQFGSLNPQTDIVRLLRLYDAGKLKLDELATRRYRLEDVNRGYDDLLEGSILRGLIIHDG